jgi:hypothetical protein
VFYYFSEHLSERGYALPAAVLAMGAVELHMRRLCRNAGIAVETTDATSYPRARAAEALNADLKAKEVYGTAEQKQITAYLDVRQNAAHGEHNKVRADVVALMIQWAKLFIAHFPA